MIRLCYSLLYPKRYFKKKNDNSVDTSPLKPWKVTPVMNYSVAKAFAILEYLAAAEGSKELGVISSALGMNKSTVYRFLATLCNLGYAEQDPQIRALCSGLKNHLAGFALPERPGLPRSGQTLFREAG